MSDTYDAAREAGLDPETSERIADTMDVVNAHWVGPGKEKARQRLEEATAERLALRACNPTERRRRQAADPRQRFAATLAAEDVADLLATTIGYVLMGRSQEPEKGMIAAQRILQALNDDQQTYEALVEKKGLDTAHQAVPKMLVRVLEQVYAIDASEEI